MNKDAVKHIVENLLNGNCSDITSQVIRDLKLSNLDEKLFSDTCLTSRLLYSNQPCSSMAKRLEKKGKSGMNNTQKFEARLKKAEDFVKSCKGNDVESFVENIDKYDLVDESIRPLFKEVLTAMVKNMQNNDCILSPIFASAVIIKCDPSFDTQTKIDFEKSLEPLVIALINSESKILKAHRFVKPDLQATEIKKQVHAIANKVGLGKIVNNYFHDLAVTDYISSTINKPDEWDIGIDTDSQNPMFYVDEQGDPKTLINKNIFYSIPIANLLRRNDSVGYYSAIRMLQGSDNTGKNATNSAYANPEKLIKLLSELLFLSDGFELNQPEKFVFAVVNPLTDIMTSIANSYDNGPARINKAVQEALAHAKSILRENNIEYLSDNSENDTETEEKSVIYLPASLENATDAQNDEEEPVEEEEIPSQAIFSAGKPVIKVENRNIALAANNAKYRIVLKVLDAEIEQSKKAAKEAIIRHIDQKKKFHKEVAKLHDPEKIGEKAEEFNKSRIEESTAVDNQNKFLLLLNEVQENARYVKGTKKNLRKGLLNKEELEQIRTILAETDSPEEIETKVKEVLKNMPSTEGMIDRVNSDADKGNKKKEEENE